MLLFFFKCTCGWAWEPRREIKPQTTSRVIGKAVARYNLLSAYSQVHRRRPSQLSATVIHLLGLLPLLSIGCVTIHLLPQGRTLNYFLEKSFIHQLILFLNRLLLLQCRPYYDEQIKLYVYLYHLRKLPLNLLVLLVLYLMSRLMLKRHCFFNEQ